MAAMKWRVMKSNRETPCCRQAIRVKIVEPGPQLRKCEICKQVNWFTLEPMKMLEGFLRLRWLRDDEVVAMQVGEAGNLHDVDIADL